MRSSNMVPAVGEVYPTPALPKVVLVGVMALWDDAKVVVVWRGLGAALRWLRCDLTGRVSEVTNVWELLLICLPLPGI